MGLPRNDSYQAAEPHTVVVAHHIRAVEVVLHNQAVAVALHNQAVAVALHNQAVAEVLHNRVVVGHRIQVAEVPHNQAAGLHILVEGVPRILAAGARRIQEQGPGDILALHQEREDSLLGRVDNPLSEREDRRTRRWLLHLQIQFHHHHRAEEDIRAGVDTLDKENT